MQVTKLLPALFIALLLASMPAVAQLKPPEPDPLARIRDAAANNVQACSATGETLCEQVAPKIIANAQGDSPLAENLRKLRAALAGNEKPAAANRAVAWAVSAFRDAGLEPHVEKYASPNGGGGETQNVVAEYRGRENPEEWVLVAARLDSGGHESAADNSPCDAASVIEAARDISLTAMHPKRSIRFVLFMGDEFVVPGSWSYVRAHLTELDHARAAIIVHSACSRVAGYSLNGRQEIESGVREAMKPIDSLGATHLDTSAANLNDEFDFVLEGIPTLTTYTAPAPVPVSAATRDVSRAAGLADLKHNIAIVAVTAFGIAERVTPIGVRQSRAEVKSLLKATGLDVTMKNNASFSQWESGERGRLP